jgi:hypothetical protein
MKAIIKENYCVLILCSLLFILFAGCSSDKEYKFTFSRQDGETYVQKLSTSRERHTGSERIEMEDTLSEARVTCRKTKDGWNLESQPVNTMMMKNGKEIKSPLFAILAKFIITYRFDNSGLLTDVQGYDKVLEAVNSHYSPEVAENLSKMINIDEIKQRETNEWKGRIGYYLGKEFSIGDTWEYDTDFTFPNGVKISYRVKTRFKEKVQRNNVTCVRIEQTYDSAGEGSTDRDGKGFDQDHGSAFIKGTVTRIIDPATMRIFSEEAKKTIHMETEMPITGKIPVEIVETRTYEYEYSR